MMYQNQIAACLKVNGKVVRDHDDTAYLPFGTEYSIFIKNLNSVRALVTVEIDGADATGGAEIIVPANGSIELERFIENGNFERGLKFKFIERTQKIEDGPRGIKVEDGLIRIQVEFEKVIPAPVYTNPYGSPSYLRTLGSGSIMGQATTTTYSSSDSVMDCSAVSMNCASYSDVAVPTKSSKSSAFHSRSLNDAGITVGGSVSEQKFVQGAWFPTTGVKHVLVMKVLGEVGEVPVKQIITPKTKTECPTCGTGNKFGNKFCRECGTGLVKV